MQRGVSKKTLKTHWKRLQRLTSGLLEASLVDEALLYTYAFAAKTVVLAKLINMTNHFLESLSSFPSIKKIRHGNHNRMVIQMGLKSTKIQKSAVRLCIHQNYFAKFPRDSAGYLGAAMPLSMASLAGKWNGAVACNGHPSNFPVTSITRGLMWGSGEILTPPKYTIKKNKLSKTFVNSVGKELIIPV